MKRKWNKLTILLMITTFVASLLLFTPGGSISAESTQQVAVTSMELASSSNGAPALTTSPFTKEQTDAWGRTAIILFGIAAVFSLATLWFVVGTISQVINGQRRWGLRGMRSVGAIIFPILVFALFAYGMYQVPEKLFATNWTDIRTWEPTFQYSVYAILFSAAMFTLYTLLMEAFPKENDRSWFQLIIMSVFSGLGNATIIFTINTAITASGIRSDQVLYYYGFGLVLYVASQRMVRQRLIRITNDLVYSKRIELVSKLLQAPFSKLESIEKGRIQAGLNNDTEMLSNFANTFISAITSSITLLFCFVYLALLNPLALLASFAVILVAVFMYMMASVANNRLWEKARDIQNTFFAYISDMIHGAKELSINSVKKQEFRKDVEESLQAYKHFRVKGEKNFSNVIIIGELLFVLVVGGVAFLFPYLFHDINLTVLQNFVFVLLYMMGPIMSLLNTVPIVLMVRIAWKRISDFNEELNELKSNGETGEQSEAVRDSELPLQLVLQNVTYEYRIENNETFDLGPINYEFRAGEIIFITGGNGSGKSTLAKLITGLYTPHSGQILVNGLPVGSSQLGALYSAVFADFYLFDRLYGINDNPSPQLIEQYMSKLRIQDKVAIKDGRFSTIRLSTGQRKRLALLLSYLEDKPIYLFDEWAADQDPEFRCFFYEELLPELKEMGKCVIAITHDDKYYHLCDKLIKMEMGKLAQEDPISATSPYTELADSAV